MFRAVRDWWSTEKARQLGGLFLFEFVVVVLGVLTAQALADWSGERIATRKMLASKTRADAQIAAMAATSIAWQRAIPCIDDRMVMIMRSASAGRRIDPAMLVRLVVRSETYSGLSDENLLRLGEQFGPATAEGYATLAFNDERARQLVNSIATAWQSLSVVSPETGDVSAGDRQEARIVASRIRSDLRSLRQSQSNISNRARDLAITPRLGPKLRMARNCAELWRQNSVVFDPEDISAARDRPAPSA